MDRYKLENIYDKHKKDYLSLKSTLYSQSGGTKKIKKGNKCDINKDDVVVHGDGGSSALIVITKSNKVYKYFTNYVYDDIDDQDTRIQIERKNKSTNNEINVYRELTKEIIDENISSHYVRYIKDYTCKEANSLFKDCPKTYDDILKLKKMIR